MSVICIVFRWSKSVWIFFSVFISSEALWIQRTDFIVSQRWNDIYVEKEKDFAVC